MDSNHRPSGYEPDELTTALPRYVRHCLFSQTNNDSFQQYEFKNYIRGKAWTRTTINYLAKMAKAGNCSTIELLSLATMLSSQTTLFRNS